MTDQPDFELYGFWRTSATYRVRVALNLKGLAAQERVINLDAGEQLNDSFLKINPLGAIPALIVKGQLPLTQSLAILEFLDETHPLPPLLPKDAKARARVRGLAQIVACDSHPLIVPRVREYLEHELKIDEPTRNAWCQNWHRAALTALETNLNDQATGRYAHGDQITVADICLASQAAGASFFKVDLGPFPTFKRVVDNCMQNEAFARAHPLRQPGAPASV
jgi:maleylacetoacetate isomerase/maleylpyruvate isomerase